MLSMGSIFFSILLWTSPTSHKLEIFNLINMLGLLCKPSCHEWRRYQWCCRFSNLLFNHLDVWNLSHRDFHSDYVNAYLVVSLRNPFSSWYLLRSAGHYPGLLTQSTHHPRKDTSLNAGSTLLITKVSVRKLNFSKSTRGFLPTCRHPFKLRWIPPSAPRVYDFPSKATFLIFVKRPPLGTYRAPPTCLHIECTLVTSSRVVVAVMEVVVVVVVMEVVTKLTGRRYDNSKRMMTVS